MQRETLERRGWKFLDDGLYRNVFRSPGGKYVVKYCKDDCEEPEYCCCWMEAELWEETESPVLARVMLSGECWVAMVAALATQDSLQCHYSEDVPDCDPSDGYDVVRSPESRALGIPDLHERNVALFADGQWRIIDYGGA